jgi:probable rRNA maturation factor
MIALEISDDFRAQIDSHLIEEAVFTSLRHQSAGDVAEMSIVITSDEKLRTLNRQYRDVDAPTDVLSFPADFTDPENKVPYLGDIIISYPRAAHQAAVGGHAVIAEIQLLVVHGVLHLLGYDHTQPSEKNEMWTAQKEILYLLGLENLKIPEGG